MLHVLVEISVLYTNKNLLLSTLGILRTKVSFKSEALNKISAHLSNAVDNHFCKSNSVKVKHVKNCYEVTLWHCIFNVLHKKMYFSFIYFHEIKSNCKFIFQGFYSMFRILQHLISVVSTHIFEIEEGNLWKSFNWPFVNLVPALG